MVLQGGCVGVLYQCIFIARIKSITMRDGDDDDDDDDGGGALLFETGMLAAP